MHLTDLFTDQNNNLDLISILGAALAVAFIAFSGYAIYKGQTFDPLNYCTGGAALIAAIGAGYRFKSGQTPTEKV